MRYRTLALTGACAAALAVALVAPPRVTGQTKSSVPRTPDGHPDLQGTYGFSNVQTAMPYTVTTTQGVSSANFGANHIGQAYASYLLGLVNTATINPTSDSRFGKH